VQLDCLVLLKFVFLVVNIGIARIAGWPDSVAGNLN
jgi:hypothetical protein